ncbi:phage major capsid protein [Phenylobacterium sp.]|uniref:phage major capsid protein n=1 Tax=Phenylobacterium sp. TaxID=1871053 RepID=UPI0025ECCF88|nr:phage major capsid protein [Phenylobacterium sp.]MCA6339023.1 phage major capsid protein [Phenylobacterium sp.]MCA6351773.1 phage major capsid protein [Phenylobacterium sp.]MCA6361326.1 phage major capsid protein [Phenylobacterium sp.]
MSKSIQDLREQRGAIAIELNALMEKTQTWGPEAQAVYDTGMAKIDEIDASIRRISAFNEKVVADALDSRVAEASARAAHDGGNVSAGRAVYQKWLRGGDAVMDAADMAVIRNVMSTTTPSEGGFTVATEVAASILDALKAFGGMRSVAEVIQTASGNPINFPTSDGTSEEGELIAENGTATDQDPVFDIRTLGARKYSSKTVAVPFELLQDSVIDVEAFVRNRLVTRLGRITNKHFTIGTGTGQPRGIVTAATSGKVGATGQTLTVTYDDLVDLQHSVDPAYRDQGQARFMMNDASLRNVRKIKDTTGRPIFVPGYEVADRGGAPDMLLGSPVTVNQDVAVMAANARSILFGDFSFYKIRDVMDVTLFRFTDSAYARKGQVGFLAWMRSDGNFVDVGGAVKFYQNSAT